MYAAGLGYMWGFSAFIYPADVLNRSLLWWPVAVWGAWVAAGRGGLPGWRTLAVAAAGLSLARPDLTRADWREAYDPLPVACQWVAGRYGPETEVWINGDDLATEPAAVYLENVRDWRTGKRTEPISWGRKTYVLPAFSDCTDALFRSLPEADSFLVLGSLTDFRFSGLVPEDLRGPGVEIEGAWTRAACPYAAGIVAMRVWRRNRDWGAAGAERYRSGDREGAAMAWKRVVAEDGAAWEAMNNLAWMALEDGKVDEARAWIDRAMEHGAARQNRSARDTEEAVRRAEGDRAASGGGGSREADREEP